ncbi:phosphatidylserine decarboxylase [Dictyostelium discoideum AX4]|uniref:phosphatidylserine decarboxylase n=1 Tax=Dictyostelium discoideum TaxID=44689 RepID=C7FZZ8_DICDI|nr:phosphatidylserine decarboxylase [Dictyostelium discoideum AX4]EEU04122.1 phosphatidylserine decarboxylase [Dictyostelium discoideum AX4]|eukprot:XP_002649174.1 phosphatidylserine decarboxylase [Dictyostelium discoideum AX4]
MLSFKTTATKFNIYSKFLKTPNNLYKSQFIIGNNFKRTFSTEPQKPIDNDLNNQKNNNQHNYNNNNNNNNNSNKDNSNSNNNNNNNKKNKLVPALIFTGVTVAAIYVTLDALGYNKVDLFKRIPFRVTSNLWGKLASIEIPKSMRSPIYKSYAKLFGVIIDEAEKPIEEYPTMGDFFARRLKPTARPIDEKADMVSPVDGTVIYHGKVDINNTLEQVKGLTYTLDQFLGPDEIAKLKGKNLYHIGLYLSPGDYHGIHSPIDWKIENRYHFPGYLFPVAKVAVDNIPGLFAMNERVVLTGNWKYGFYSLTPVGASNVGTIVMDFDKELSTNDQSHKYHKNEFFKKQYPSSINSSKGSELAFFRMGSTVIMIFEVPQNKKFDFNINPGQHVKLGQSMGKLN